jgi:hypothetical protein
MTTGDDFIALAGRLAAGANPSPIVLRTAINRSYYGALHLTRQFLLSLGLAWEKRHNLDRLLCNCGNPDAEQAGKILSDLYERRYKADYELEHLAVETFAYAHYAVEMAHRFRSCLDKCRAEPTSAAVKAGIEAYRKRIGGRGPG